MQIIMSYLVQVDEIKLLFIMTLFVVLILLNYFFTQQHAQAPEAIGVQRPALWQEESMAGSQ